MSEALQQIIRQAEIQKLQMEMNLLFNKNMALFKKKMPKVYKILEGKTAKDWLVRLDADDNLNIYSREYAQFLYDTTPSDYAHRQVEDFALCTRPRKFQITKNKPYNDKHIHIPKLNDLIDDYESSDKAPRLAQTPNHIFSLIVSGVGLGYHLSELISKLDIKNIVIYEGNVDVFLASMQTTDWEPILDYFFEPERTIGLCIGVEPRYALAQLEYNVNNIGLFSLAYGFVLQHTKRNEEVALIDAYERDLGSYVGGVGYFDDEQIGLAHAYHNVQTDAAVFVNRKTHQRKVPVFLIGNGPSLDLHEDYIKTHRENVIIMSCGTALTSLLRMGIKPDFHVEMERCLLVSELINYGSKPAEREGITLLCLHPVSPETVKSFDDACYAIKPNDAGGTIVHQYFEDTKLNELFYCNPTVSNCGLAFAVSMGFESIHLIGTDFGVKTSDEHHSKHSIYGDMEADMRKRNAMQKIFPDHKAVTRPGNFGGEVMTSPVLDMARVSIERYLTLIGSAFPNLRVINSNNGALINGADPVPIDALPKEISGDKATEIAAIKEDHFHYFKNTKNESSDPKDILRYFYSIEKNLLLKEKVTSDLDIYKELRRIFKIIDKKNDAITSTLLKGSINFFFTCIAEHTFLCKNPGDRQKRYDLGRKHYNAFITNVYEKMKDSPFSLDDTHSKFVQRIKSD